MNDRSDWNACRYQPGDIGGHYESYFQRANHPELPLGFWIRYTIFSPKDRPLDAVGELWAIHFDGVAGEIVAVKQVFPFVDCSFSRGQLKATIGEAVLGQDHLEGQAETDGHRLGWSLQYDSPSEPLLLLPEQLYSGGFPKAKGLVGSPLAVYSGSLTVDGREVAIDDWVGSQNHNWGIKHTDEYAWGQVAGFDGEPEALLECVSARLRLGPVWSPLMHIMVLRLDGREHRLNSIPQALKARGSYDFFMWSFDSRTKDVRISGQFAAAPEAFVGLPYDNPPGGRKTCLNSKIARCQLTVQHTGQPPRTLVSKHRAAFEITTDRQDHGVRVLDV